MVVSKIKGGTFMGLTSKSMGTKLLNEEVENLKKEAKYTIAIAGNPNVRKIHSI